MSVEMVETWINDRWPLLLPKHRHDRPEWPHWEAGRLASMYHEIGWWDRDYPPRDLACTLGPPPREVVYDIGAEEGDFPALWSSWGCDVVLFEPNDRVWPNIAAIWKANDLRPPLLLIPGFAGPEPRPIDNRIIVHSPQAGWDHVTGAVIPDHGFLNLCERPDVQVVPIDFIVSEGLAPPPTAITMDIEGAEMEAMLGARQTLEQHRPLVWISVHPEFARDMYDRPNILGDLQDLFDRCDYGLGEHIATDHEQHWLWRPL